MTGFLISGDQPVAPTNNNLLSTTYYLQTGSETRFYWFYLFNDLQIGEFQNQGFGAVTYEKHNSFTVISCTIN